MGIFSYVSPLFYASAVLGCYRVFRIWYKRHTLRAETADVASLLSTFNPDPLVPDTAFNQIIVYNSSSPTEAIINNKKLLNMANCDFLVLSRRKTVLDACADSIDQYGIGSCGPRGFLGTMDIHLKLEARIAHHYNQSDSVLYPLGHAASSSVLQCFASRGDLIFIDEFCNTGLKTAAVLSRAELVYYKHNNIKNLRELVITHAVNFDISKFRIWIVIESISRYDGTVCPVSQIIDLSRQFDCRILIDESLAVGIYGPQGRGLLYEKGFSINDVDLFIGSLEYSFAGLGGFCLSKHSEALDHQRLAAQGYVFSASIPPFLAQSALSVLEILSRETENLAELKLKSNYLDEKLQSVLIGHGLLRVISERSLPIKSIVFIDSKVSKSQQEDFFSNVFNKLIDCGILTCLDNCFNESNQCPPSLKIIITRHHTYEMIDNVVDELQGIISLS
ncbi:hypothetical protein RCL1_005249 [Eukaryota sp. TZLM3-RCL]